VNAKKQEGSLHDWILPNDNPLSDVYAVGFQEIVDLNAMNVALNSSETIKKTQFWHDKIAECLNTTPVKFTLIMEKALVGLLVCVYVREDLMPHVSDVRCTSTGVGLMGMMGNKGGVSVRFSLYDSSLCFVCSHLAAHRENIAGRNSDFKNIIERSVFPADPTNVEVPSSVPGDDSLANIKMPKRVAIQNLSHDLQILDHEMVFWIGDLNYRIDDVFSTEEVFTLIEEGELGQLRDKDQLNIERAKGNVFQGFDEGVLEFCPTYKYQPGTDMYDRRPEKKIRAPAWCDRVLWRSEKPGAVRQTNYRCAQLHPSDHKPVSSQLNTDVRTIVEASQRVVFGQLMEVLKKHTSTALPTVEINGLVVNLDKVEYEVHPFSSVQSSAGNRSAEYCFITVTSQQPQVSKLEIKNVGAAIVHWHFVPKLDEPRICKQWISLSEDSGLLLPGEVTAHTQWCGCRHSRNLLILSLQAAIVDVTVNVNTRAAQLLNAGKDVRTGTLNSYAILVVYLLAWYLLS
jgi:phosphatidylinositol-bisphosphatase